MVSVEGRRRRGKPVTLLGGDDRRPDEATQPAISSIASLHDLARGFWGESVPGEELLARISREAEASDILGHERLNDNRFVGVVPSPLAPVHRAGFGRFRVDQAVVDEMVAAFSPSLRRRKRRSAL